MKSTIPPLIAVVASLCVLTITGCSKHAPSSETHSALPTAQVQVHVIEEASHQAFEEAVGTIRARLRSTVEAKINGRIEKLPVVTGQPVAEGDLIAQLDAGEIEARLDQAVAVRDQADADLQRFAALLQQEAVTRAEFDAVQARQRVAQATVVEAQTLLNNARVVAPFDGVITRKHADVGDLAAPGRPLVEIEDPTQFRLEANVPEALIAPLQPGNQLQVRIDSLPQPIEGVVAEIDPAADPNSRTFLVKLDLPSIPGLRAGQFGRAAIPAGEFAALRIPTSAVVQRGQLEIVFVAHENHAQLRIIKTGKRRQHSIEVLSGIDPQEKIITNNVAALIDGQPIQIQN